jgi:hypothetical protein
VLVQGAIDGEPANAAVENADRKMRVQLRREGKTIGRTVKLS